MLRLIAAPRFEFAVLIDTAAARISNCSIAYMTSDGSIAESSLSLLL
jgi:hypothetical protein